jgi:hypothetical protein
MKRKTEDYVTAVCCRVFPAYLVLVAAIAALTGVYLTYTVQNHNELRRCADSVAGEPTDGSTNGIGFTGGSIPSPTPWSSIGGCGAGGSGGGVADGIQWLGNGVQGGLIDMELLPRYVIRRNFKQTSIAPRLSFKPTWTTMVGLSLPIMSKSGAVQYQSNVEEVDRTTGGMGDLTIDVSKSIGFAGEYQIQLSLTLPTGQYDIKRGSDRAQFFLPVDFQMGSGLYTPTLQLSRSIDVEDGFWKIDVSYSHPFNAKPFSRKNAMLDTYFADYKDRTDNRRFYYRGKPYGENDLGGYTPPSASVTTYFAWRGVEGYVHSWGIYLSAPFGVAWIPEPSVGEYAPKPDPDHKAWNGALIYGLEFSRQKYPVFCAISLPLHDRADPFNRIDGPDWSDFLNQWIFAVGIKSTMF